MKLIKSLYIKQFVGFSFGLVLLLALLISLAGRVAYEISHRQNDIIQTRSRVNGLTLNLQILTIERVDTLRRYLESGDRRLQLLYQSQRANYLNTFNDLAALLRSQEEALALQSVLAAENTLNDLVEETFQLYEAGAVAEAQQLWAEEGQALQSRVVASTELWAEIQAENNEMIVQQARQTETIAVNGVTIFSILALVVGVGASLWVTRSITQPISRLVEETKTVDLDPASRIEPHGPREIAFLGKSINHMANRLLASKRAIQHHRDQLERELQAASQTQLSFLPTANSHIAGLDVAFYWQPARQLAGDFYTYAHLPQERVGLLLGDVVGKGAAAAMAGALTLGLAESKLAAYDQPETLLYDLNRELCLRFKSDRLKVACTYAIFDEPSRQLHVANAGCIFPYLRRGNKLCEIDVWGVPLGLSPDFEYRPQTIILEPGDLLLLSSDGLVEAQNQAGDLFGFERLEINLGQIPTRAPAQMALQQLIKALETFTGLTDLSDDVTLIVIRVGD